MKAVFLTAVALAMLCSVHVGSIGVDPPGGDEHLTSTDLVLPDRLPAFARSGTVAATSSTTPMTVTASVTAPSTMSTASSDQEDQHDIDTEHDINIDDAGHDHHGAGDDDDGVTRDPVGCCSSCRVSRAWGLVYRYVGSRAFGRAQSRRSGHVRC